MVFDPEGLYGGGGGGGGGPALVPVYTRILRILAERFEKDLVRDRPHLVGLIIG